MECQASQRIHFTAITFIPYDRVSQLLHVYTNLILTTCFQLQFYQRIAISAFYGTVVSNRIFSTIINWRRTYIQLTVGKPRFHSTLIFFHISHHDRNITAIANNIMGGNNAENMFLVIKHRDRIFSIVF